MHSLMPTINRLGRRLRQQKSMKPKRDLKFTHKQLIGAKTAKLQKVETVNLANKLEHRYITDVKSPPAHRYIAIFEFVRPFNRMMP